MMLFLQASVFVSVESEACCSVRGFISSESSGSDFKAATINEMCSFCSGGLERPPAGDTHQQEKSQEHRVKPQVSEGGVLL